MVSGLCSDWARKRAKRATGSEARAIVIRRVFRGIRGRGWGIYTSSRPGSQRIMLVLRPVYCSLTQLLVLSAVRTCPRRFLRNLGKVCVRSAHPMCRRPIMAATSPDNDTGELIERASQGDASARQQLLIRHRERLRLMVALRMDARLVARVDPSDIVQEALVDATHHLDDFLRDRPLPFYLWLRRLAWEQLIKAQ